MMLLSNVEAVRIGIDPTFGFSAQDTPANSSGVNQMRMNINITNTVVLQPGTYRATTWDYIAAPDSTVPGVTQGVFPFLTAFAGSGTHRVLAYGALIDTEPGIQQGVAFGGENAIFTLTEPTTVAAGIQNPSEPGVQNSILTNLGFGTTDHTISANFNDAAGVGNVLNRFSNPNLTRTYGFVIEVEEHDLADVDGDGLPGNWEEANGLDDTDDGTAGESVAGLRDGPNGALGDPDGDGLGNAEELEQGTDPQNPDSDGDNLADGAEVARGADPRDPDTDNDGLLDGVETGTGVFVDESDTGTDPAEADSDGDLIPDGIEIEAGTDPNDPASKPEVNLANHQAERVLYRRTDNLPGADFTGALPENIDVEAPFGDPDDPATSLLEAINVDREPGSLGVDLTGDNHDLAFVFQFYDADGVFSFTENYDDRVKVVATPIAGATNLTARGDSAQHTNTGWNQRSFANFDFGLGGWFNVDIWMSEDGGGAQSAADIGFGYYRDFSLNTADFGGIGYVSTFGISSGSRAEFDRDGFGASWGVYVESFDPDLDTDGDSIPDGFEEQFFPGDLTQLGEGDFDEDGLTDAEEYEGGTDPTSADTDEDGVGDASEIANETDPTDPDTDGDGLSDGVEAARGTNPLVVDSDGDGRSDSEEVALGSDPNDPASPGFITIGYGPNLTGVVDTPAGNSSQNQMRQNINITDTVFLEAGTYHAKVWNYNAAADSGVPGVTQPVFPFLTIMNGPGSHTVIAVGETIDTEPGIQWAVPFGGESAVFTIPEGGATVAAGIQNTNAPGVTNSIITNTGFGNTDHSNNTNFDEAGGIGNILDSFSHFGLTRTYGFSIDISPGSGTDPLELDVDLSPGNPGQLRLTWNSTPGKVYDVLVSPDLSRPRADWSTLDGAEDIPADPSGVNTLDIGQPFAGLGFVAIREEEAPPLFFDDLESGAGDWTTVVNDATGNTQWEFGTPNGSTGPVEGAEGSSNAWTTGLGDYFSDADISLRSPEIDLSGLTGAELSFAAFRDADGVGDTATVRFLRASDLVQLGADTPLDMSIFDTEYVTIVIPVTPQALGESILVEWNFVSVSSVDAFSGLSIDNVGVSPLGEE